MILSPGNTIVAFLHGCSSKCGINLFLENLIVAVRFHLFESRSGYKNPCVFFKNSCKSCKIDFLKEDCEKFIAKL